ncbi:hypothetical protein CS542_05355 [Pedobacter sp. IW39]|nr:hypothetical protein CS542_05355 [Pedobacter sp. IW39]
MPIIFVVNGFSNYYRKNPEKVIMQPTSMLILITGWLIIMRLVVFFERMYADVNIYDVIVSPIASFKPYC